MPTSPPAVDEAMSSSVDTATSAEPAAPVDGNPPAETPAPAKPPAPAEPAAPSDEQGSAAAPAPAEPSTPGDDSPPAPAPAEAPSSAVDDASVQPPVTAEPVAPLDEAQPAEPPTTTAAVEPPPSATPRATDGACPCPPDDDRCRQLHLVECSPNASAATVVDGTDASDSKSDAGQASTPANNRHGLLLGGTLSFVGCNSGLCNGYNGGVGGQLEAGYRFGWVAPLLSVSAGGGPIEASKIAGVAASQRFVDIGVGALLLPLRRGRIDPFVGARLGWAHAATTIRDRATGQRGLTSLSRGGVRITAGVDVYLNEWVALGPRFDMTFGFSGRLCSESPATTTDNTVVQVRECFAARQFTTEVRREFPRPWSLGLDVRVVLPRRNRA
ncbi:MAG: porin family protein [Deltaproteobacteria bacterium]|nr:porin family protein [Deltaproteobacteria bacterium]